MSNDIITRFSFDTGQEERYQKIVIEEEVSVKKDKFRLCNIYYKRLSDGELFEPFDDPDYNLRRAYDLYRERYQLLSPDEIKAIRNRYELSVRDFAKILGLSYSNLSLIENGGLQSNYIDSSLRLSRNVGAFKQLVEDKKQSLDGGVYSRLMDRLNELLTGKNVKSRASMNKSISLSLNVSDKSQMYFINIDDMRFDTVDNRKKEGSTWKKFLNFKVPMVISNH